MEYVAMAEAKAEIEKHFAILDKHLAGKTYLVAEQFSLAEVCYMPFLEFLPLMEITPPASPTSRRASLALESWLLTRRRSASDYPVARSRLWHKSDKRNVPDRECSHAVVQSGSPDRDRRPCARNRRSCASIERPAVSCLPPETPFCEWTSPATAPRRLAPRLSAPLASDVSKHQNAHRWPGLVQEQDDRSLIVPFSHTPSRKVAFEYRTSKTDASCPWCDLKHRTWLRDASESEATTGYQRASANLDGNRPWGGSLSELETAGFCRPRPEPGRLP